MPPLFGRIASFISFKTFPLFIGAILLLNIVMVELVNKKVGKDNRPDGDIYK